MTTKRQTPRVGAQARENGLSGIGRLYHGLAKALHRCGRLGAQMRRLGCWLEKEVFPDADKVRQEALTLRAQPDGTISIEQVDGDRFPTFDNCPDVCALLDRLAIRKIRVDTRLESNQIEDVLVLLSRHKRELAARGGTPPAGGILHQLISPGGLHFNCMQITLHDGLLAVRYSYCVTRLSLAVRWFEKRHHRFEDHRALFHAAPRYGLLAAALSGGVLAGYLLTWSPTFLVVATVVESAILFAAVYVFMRGMGSVEYDNEESAYRLAQAHAKVTKYARRIGQDLDLARTVQRKLLPDGSRMPLPGRLEWASHFNPEAEVGGDYFDVASLDEDTAAIVFSDVSGHGMSAALITVIVKMAFQAWVDAGWPLTDFVRCVNRDLCRFTPDGSFVVLIAAVYDAKRRCLRFVNAGHSPVPSLLPADRGKPVVPLMDVGSMLLGLQMDIEITETTWSLTEDDTILLATDGLTEARNSRGELYGKDRLRRLLEDSRDESLQGLVSSLLKDVDRFAAGAPQTDDRTVLAFRTVSNNLQPLSEYVEVDRER